MWITAALLSCLDKEQGLVQASRHRWNSSLDHVSKRYVAL